MIRTRIALGALAGLAVVWWLAFCFEEQLFSSPYKIAVAATGYLTLVGLGVLAACGLPGSRK